jgi:predicted metal-dependent phosphoesterase TrpH
LNTSIRADLHCHSFFSDGNLSPDAIIEKAVEANIELLALTDHDTIAGCELLRVSARDKPIKLIDGIEISVRWKLHDIHVLGLNIDIGCPVLTSLLHKQNTQRSDRGRQMADALVAVGVHEGYEKACLIAGHERIGRPHLAQVLINEGIVPDMQTAFKRYLARGKLAYVPTSWLSVEEAVSGIVNSGGQAVIAHPLKYKLTRTKLLAFIREFKEVGGVGMEVVSGEMDASQIGEMAGLCTRFDLFASTGSDYHSDTYSRIKLGQQRPLPEHCRPIWTLWDLL